MKPAYKPVLCVVSSHPIKGASGVPTGFFLAELTHPLKVLEDAGIKTTIASIRGGQPPVDGFDLSDPVNAWYWNETDFQQRLATTPALSELKGADYSAVFFAAPTNAALPGLPQANGAYERQEGRNPGKTGISS